MSNSTKFSGVKLPLLLAAPQLLIVFIWFYYPSIQALYWSFTLEPPFGGDKVFVGMSNIIAVVTAPEFVDSLITTLIFTVGACSISIGLALIFAMFADYVTKGKKIYRMIFIVPYAVASPVVAAAWVFVLHPDLGLISFVNDIWPGAWDPFLNGTHAKILIIIAYAWSAIAYNFVFILAGFQSVPKALNEAAAMDGASPWRRYRDIYFPLLTPTLFFVTIMNVTESLTQSFGLIHAMTQGGPAGSTRNIVYKIFEDGFIGMDFSGASAQSIILMLLLVSMSVIQFTYIEKRVNYQQ
ncbi:sugar ABC transporter permease [Vibrio mediterranei]|jgi:sn-glycerol 3-phosphate transport system permease protein|uniref:carbohydrate ABC transporter permease n=1 Tax=Vibrio mediterranei TaxID=689 RepID=UPI001EFD2F15|nr:sugar ABC transporter permease [Vibrio mediterranei]MCG9628833.1 sugar ABC transporter permease [Vibrio mediterranei]MCY9856114.1 sugar ABC transporter permease [Vibrio mediterranei]